MFLSCFTQTPAAQSQSEADMLPELSGSNPSPHDDHLAPPPSTVDTAALSEDPPAGRPGRQTGHVGLDRSFKLG